MVRALEGVTGGKVVQVSGIQVLIRLKVRPEIPPSAGFTHVRLGRFINGEVY
jgi:hypothetical protein